MVLEQTDAFRVLASADRQLVLHELLALGRDESMSVTTLSERVASRRNGISPEKISVGKTDRAQVRLVHLHFPQLLSRDIISVDWDDNEVSLTDDENVETLLEAAEELERWPPEDRLTG
ncbi:DUF7344 domain-containing protein [Natronorubrum halophilum]|uniref:DUF7344 domain-containing protein n=1 Tax=Natronorubrum halophilum TaxID=1702106 RepID=UPI0030B81557